MCHRHTTSSKRQPSSKILPKSLPTSFSTPLSQDKQNCARNQHRKAPGSIPCAILFPAIPADPSRSAACAVSPPWFQDKFASGAHAGTQRAGFSPKVARVLCPGIQRVGKKSDRSLGRDSSLMRIVFRIGLLTRAVQKDNATVFYKTRSWYFLQNTFMVKCHRTPPVNEYAETLSLSS